ncbi:MAG: AAA family ATPase [Rhodobacteraceae bacterium]|nr:AAA family ATPase [Paracoccaceae bacterium]
MIGARQLARAASKLNDLGAKPVLVGDPDQLQPIEAGTPFCRWVERQGAAQLTETHCQREGWQKLASRSLADGRVPEAVAQYTMQGAVSRVVDREAAIESLVETYAMGAAANGNPTSRLAFAHKRKDVHALNQVLRAVDDSSSELLFSTDTGQRAFANTDRIVFTRNDRDIGVKNGMLGTASAVSEREIVETLYGDSPRTIKFDPHKPQSFDHGYAVTIHKSQGATLERKQNGRQVVQKMKARMQSGYWVARPCGGLSL